MNIQINNLLKEYEGKKVLEIGNIQIKAGTFLGIIGPNGAGKSTLIRILSGLEEATSGEVLYNGEKLQESHYKQMTLVFQKPYLTRSTVFDDIAYPLRLRKKENGAIIKEVNLMLEEMGLMGFKDKKTWTLSGGEMQKVALARALIFKPQLLMLDEPTANIDPSSISVMERMLKKVNDQYKTTIIIITHNLPQALRLCNEVVFMNKGNVIEYGNTEKIILKPKSIETKKFIVGELLV